MSKAVNLGTLADDISVSNGKANLSGVSLTPGSAPSSPVQGDMYLDSSDGRLKIYTGTVWKNILSGQDITASGGTQYDYGNYKLHIFTESGIFRPEGLTEVDVMIVGGGGSGGTDNSGGGGAGGLIWLQNLAVSNQDYTILIGGPSADNSSVNTRSDAGNPSSAFGYTALGGGYGGTGDAGLGYNGGPGGSGGGGASESGVNGSGGAGTVGQGNNGADSANLAGGGGGGAGSVGQAGNVRGSNLGGNGGDGLDMSSYFGIEFGENGWFAGGGGGGNENSINNPSSGGMGGGGDSPYDSHTNSTRGQVNTGGGGGGGTYNSSATVLGSGGGSGIVIIRYYLY